VPLIGSGDLGVYRLSLVPAVGAAGTETNPYSLLGMLGVNLARTGSSASRRPAT
jgi:hypothetical protein